MEAIFIRHAQAESNIAPAEEGVVGSDLTLTAEGMQQAAAAADYLAQLAINKVVGPLPDVIYSSPYKRTQQTAQVIAEVLGRSIVTDKRLQEIQKGDWHDMRVADVLPLESVVSDQDKPHFRPPNGENWYDVAERMTSFIYEKEENGEKSLIIISHNHPIEAAIGKLCGLDIYDWKKRPVDNASITRLFKNGEFWEIDENIYNTKGY